MEESYGEYVAPTDAIRDILRAYPLSIGLLREIIQNSDDAKAQKQVHIFPLDLILAVAHLMSVHRSFSSTIASTRSKVNLNIRI